MIAGQTVLATGLLRKSGTQERALEMCAFQVRMRGGAERRILGAVLFASARYEWPGPARW